MKGSQTMKYMNMAVLKIFEDFSTLFLNIALSG